MQELRDSEMDALIARALKADGGLSQAQMQRAREALYRQAAQQTMLPPAALPLMARLRNGLSILARSSALSVYQFITDDTAYRRAQNNDRGLSYHRYNLRVFSSTEFMMIA